MGQVERELPQSHQVAAAMDRGEEVEEGELGCQLVPREGRGQER